MPASSKKLIKGNQRQRLGPQVKVSKSEELTRRFGAVFEVVIEAESDGLVAYIGRYGLGASACVPHKPGIAGGSTGLLLMAS